MRLDGVDLKIVEKIEKENVVVIVLWEIPVPSDIPVPTRPSDMKMSRSDPGVFRE